MIWSTRAHCTVQQLCALVLMIAPFAYFSASWMGLVFLGLLMLFDNGYTWLNNAFKVRR